MPVFWKPCRLDPIMTFVSLTWSDGLYQVELQQQHLEIPSLYMVRVPVFGMAVERFEGRGSVDPVEN